MRRSLAAAARLEEWARGSSYLHRRDPRAKITAAIVLLTAISTTPVGSYYSLAAIGCVLAAAAVSAGLPVSGLLGRAALVIPFPLFFGTINWLQTSDWRPVTSMTLRSYQSAFTVLILMGTTGMPDLLAGLRSLRSPAILLLVIQSLVRYLQLTIDQGLRMRTAAICRGGHGGTVGQRKSLLRRFAGALAVLFGRSYIRAEGVHRAMLARGFRGDFISQRPYSFDGADWLFLIAAVSFAVLVRVGGVESFR